MERKRKIPYSVINWAKLVRECLFAGSPRCIREVEGVEVCGNAGCNWFDL